MALKIEEYTRLPTGGGLGLMRRISLWQGSDHLLKVTNLGFTEDYLRFYYKDIQAISVLVTRRRRIWAIVIFLDALIWSLISYSIGGKAGLVWGAALIIPAAIAFVINLLKGPGCQCQIHTAVQSVKIESLRRLPKAQQFLSIVRPLILAAQQDFAEQATPPTAEVGPHAEAAPATPSPAADAPTVSTTRLES